MIDNIPQLIIWFLVISGSFSAGAIVGGIMANSGRDQEERDAQTPDRR